MKTVNLYTGGGVSLSPVDAPDRVLSAYVRLIAEEGGAITDGDRVLSCVDVLASDAGNWKDCQAEDEEVITDEEALGIILGGAV